jgi:hypothetical protein
MRAEHVARRTQRGMRHVSGLAQVVFVTLTFRSPRIQRLLYRFKPHRRGWRAAWDADVVIEGAGGCGLSSFVVYFKRFNPGVRVGHHTHVYASVRWAARLGLPCVVLERRGEEAARSIASRFPGVPNWLARYRCWLFERELHAHAGDRVLRVSFDELIARGPARVIDDINASFATSFDRGDGILPHTRPTRENAAGLEGLWED